MCQRSLAPSCSVLVISLWACAPSISLGRDDPTTSSETTQSPGTTSGDAGAASTSADGSATSTGGGTTQTSGGLGCEQDATTPCLACAHAECCEELELCAGQKACACFLDCLLAEAPPEACQATCMPSSGVAAVVVCVQTSCGDACGEPPGSTGGANETTGGR